MEGWDIWTTRTRLSQAHDTEGVSPHSRARQAWLSRLRHPLPMATVKVMEVASRRAAGLRRPAVCRPLLPRSRALPSSEP